MVSNFEQAINSKQILERNKLLEDLCARKLELLMYPRKSTILMIKCSICDQNFPIVDIITLECEHRFCKTDLQSNLISKIASPYFLPKNLVCKVCLTPISHFIIKDNVPKHLFDKYDEILVKNLVNDLSKQVSIKRFQFIFEHCGNSKKDFEIRILDCEHK